MALRPRIARSVVAVPPRERAGMDDAHRKRIKLLPCLACGRRAPSDPHHLQRGLPPKERGMGRKASDQYLIPLCRVPNEEGCHDKAEAGGDDEGWLAGRGIPGRDIARALWAARGDLPAMQRIVLRSLTARGVYGVRLDG